MKAISSITALVASSCLLLPAAFADSATTVPVGYVSLGNTTEGQPAVSAKTDVWLSVPMMRASEFRGTIASISGNTITLNGTPGFDSDQWADEEAPNYFVIESGDSNGIVGLISANTGDELTVILQPGNDLDDVQAGDKISISKAWTLGNLFEDNTLPNGVEMMLFSGTTSGVNIASNLIYYHSGGTWRSSATFLPSNNVVLYPNESFIFRNTTSTPIDELVVAGEVPQQEIHSVVAKISSENTGQDVRISYFNPVGEKLGESGLGFFNGDEILVVNNTVSGINKSAKTYYFSNGNWRDGATFALANDIELEGGKGYVYRFSPLVPSVDVLWKNEQSYHNNN